MHAQSARQVPSHLCTATHYAVLNEHLCTPRECMSYPGHVRIHAGPVEALPPGATDRPADEGAAAQARRFTPAAREGEPNSEGREKEEEKEERGRRSKCVGTYMGPRGRGAMAGLSGVSLTLPRPIKKRETLIILVAPPSSPPASATPAARSPFCPLPAPLGVGGGGVGSRGATTVRRGAPALAGQIDK